MQSFKAKNRGFIPIDKPRDVEQRRKLMIDGLNRIDGGGDCTHLVYLSNFVAPIEPDAKLNFLRIAPSPFNRTTPEAA